MSPVVIDHALSPIIGFDEKGNGPLLGHSNAQRAAFPGELLRMDRPQFRKIIRASRNLVSKPWQSFLPGKVIHLRCGYRNHEKAVVLHQRPGPDTGDIYRIQTRWNRRVDGYEVVPGNSKKASGTLG